MENIKYWIIVASNDHVQRGVAEGFCQACHGKSNPLKRMNPDDWVIFYSPKTEFKGNERYQSFSAIGRVKPGSVYQGNMGGGFKPYRRDVAFLECNQVPIHPLIPDLSFIKNKQSWGYMFRFGFFEIPKDDFDLISSLMLSEHQEAEYEN